MPAGSVYIVVLTVGRRPFPDQVLDLFSFDDKYVARMVAWDWSQLDEVRDGRWRVQVLPREVSHA